MDSILIIGGNGFLGSHLATRAGALGMHVSVVGTAQRSTVPNAAYYRADIGDFRAMQAVFQAVSPRFVVNSAAIADIDYAEQYPEEALRVNALGAEVCVKLAAEHHARHLFFSSDAVFDGTKAAYSEDDATNPCNYYGRTKELAEQKVALVHPDAVIARVSLLLGRSSGNSGVVDPLMRRLEAGDVAFSNRDQIRTPIDIYTLADVTFELLARQECSGLVHLACTEAASKLKICRDIARGCGYDPERVQPYPEGSARGAKRHLNGVLSAEKAARVLERTHLPTLEGTIARAMLGR